MANKKKEKMEQQATQKEESKARTTKNTAKEVPMKSAKTMDGLYKNMKEKHSDAVLFFRTGDFYTALNADASRVATTLGSAATKLAKAEDEELKAIFPHHALDTNLPQLIRAGLRMAIVDGLEKKEGVEKSASVKTEVKEQNTTTEDKATTVKQEHQPRPPQMVTVNGDKVSHAHAFQSKLNSAD